MTESKGWSLIEVSTYAPPEVDPEAPYVTKDYSFPRAALKLSTDSASGIFVEGLLVTTVELSAPHRKMRVSARCSRMMTLMGEIEKFICADVYVEPIGDFRPDRFVFEKFAIEPNGVGLCCKADAPDGKAMESYESVFIFASAFRRL